MQLVGLASGPDQPTTTRPAEDLYNDTPNCLNNVTATAVILRVSRMWHRAEGMVGKMSDTEGRNVEQSTPGRTEDDPDVTNLAEDVPPSQRVEETQSDDEITERIRRQGVKITRGTIAPTVFWPSLILIVLVAGLTILAPDTAGTVLNATQGWIVENSGLVLHAAGGCLHRLHPGRQPHALRQHYAGPRR